VPAPRAIHAAIVLKPLAADHHVGVTVPIEVGYGQSFAVRAIGRVMTPLIGAYLAPEVDFVSGSYSISNTSLEA
jgi:hypothetical protein